MLEKIIFWSIIGLMVIVGVGIGWSLNESYDNYTNKQTLRGLWFGDGNWNYTDVKYSANKLDSTGHWVCVNVQEEYSYDDIIKICEHESAHELFARQCSANIEECMKLMELMDKNANP